MAPNSISVDGSNVESVENFIYLGSLQSSNGCCSQDLKRCIGLASSVMASLHRIWKDQRLMLTTKLWVYEALVLSVLIYLAETWTLLVTDMRALEAFHMKCQHQILGIRWFDFVSNVDVQARTGLTTLGESLAARHISVFGHIAWLDIDVPAHVVLYRHIDLSVGRLPGPNWRRRPGRPCTRLMGFEQFSSTSGTLEACHPPWPCCWSDATSPAGCATLMMMMMMRRTQAKWYGTTTDVPYRYKWQK